MSSASHILITVFTRDDKIVRATAPTIQLQSGTFDWYHYFDARRSGKLQVADEGVTWIRGDHREDSEEVEAMKAANMLAREETRPANLEERVHRAFAEHYENVYLQQSSRPTAPPRFRPVLRRDAMSFRRR